MNIIIIIILLVHSYQLIANIFFYSSKGVTIELAFKKPYFTAYASTSILNLESLISKWSS